jgi:tRNA U55 pseudouridine synthase TruB
MLGCGAVMTDLKRTSNGIFTADQAVDIRTIKSSDLNYVKSIIRPIDEPLSFRKTDIGEKEAKDLSDGKIIKISGTYDENERLKVYCNSKFVGVGIYNEKVLKADKIFNTEIR